MSCPDAGMGSEVMQEMSDNEVLLRGRVRHDPEERALQSGTRLVTVRVVVPREGTGERPGSDWVDCAVWAPRVQRRVLGWHEGDHVEVRGALRRRFFRYSAGETGTRLEVEVLGGRLLKRSA